MMDDFDEFGAEDYSGLPSNQPFLLQHLHHLIHRRRWSALDVNAE
jgi:hypothetical protein